MLLQRRRITKTAQPSLHPITQATRKNSAVSCHRATCLMTAPHLYQYEALGWGLQPAGGGGVWSDGGQFPTCGVVAVTLVLPDVVGPVAVAGVKQVDVLVVVTGQQFCKHQRYM